MNPAPTTTRAPHSLFFNAVLRVQKCVSDRLLYSLLNRMLYAHTRTCVDNPGRYLWLEKLSFKSIPRLPVTLSLSPTCVAHTNIVLHLVCVVVVVVVPC